MTEPAPPMITGSFTEAMRRVEALRFPPKAPEKLLRRSFLMTPSSPQTSFSLLNFLGWVHTGGKLRPVVSKKADDP